MISFNPNLLHLLGFSFLRSAAGRNYTYITYIKFDNLEEFDASNFLPTGPSALSKNSNSQALEKVFQNV